MRTPVPFHFCAAIVAWGCGQPPEESNDVAVDAAGTIVDSGAEAADAGSDSSGGADMPADAGVPWPNHAVGRTATSGDVSECHGATQESTYLGSYRIETTCGGAAPVVVTIDDVWYEPEVYRPRVNDTLVPEPFPALLGTVSLSEGTAFWENTYFYGQCTMFGPPPGGIALDLPGTTAGTAWISCYAGLGTDAGEEEQCIAFSDDGSPQQAGCTVSAVPN